MGLLTPRSCLLWSAALISQLILPSYSLALPGSSALDIGALPHFPLENENLTLSPVAQLYHQHGWLPPPSIDPWYSPPSGWESTAPGTPLRIRQPAYPTIKTKNCFDTLQILYRSSDTHGQPSWAVTTIFRPLSFNTTTSNSTAPLKKSAGVVSYLVPSDSVALDAAPSYLLQEKEPYGEMRDLLARGWIVAVPDYEGPQASYCAGAQAGYATLDSVRAMIRSADKYMGIESATARFAIWGYSGGAFAAAFAMELMEEYAGDLKEKVVGAAVGGPALNLTTVAMAMNGKGTAGLMIASLLGVTRQWSEASEYLRSRLKTEGAFNATGFLAAERMSGVEALMTYLGQNVYDYFVGGEKDVWHPIVQAVVDKDAVMGVRGAPPGKVPVFVYKAAKDEMSPVEETDGLVSTYCAKGARVLYHRNHIGMHNDELWSGRLRTMDFLRHVLDDWRGTNITVPEEGKCLTEDVNVPLDVLCLLPDWWSPETPRTGCDQGLR